MINKKINSFRYAFNGICEALKTQWNMRIHFVCAVAVITAGIYFEISPTEWVFIIICIGLVIAFEMLNTALEYLVDLVSPDYHPLAGKVKDIAAGSVLIAAIASLAAGAIIFIPRLAALF